MKYLTFTLALGAMLCMSGGAYAQQSNAQTLPDHGKVLAYNKFWISFSATFSIPNPVGTCFTEYNAPTLFSFEAAKNGTISIIAMNKSWSLPVNADTHIAFLIDGHFYTYDATNISLSNITSNVNKIQLVSLIKNIESAHSVQLQVGSLPPMNVDLDGSKAILQTFIKCSDLQNFSSNKDAVNPFGSSN